MPRVSSFFRPVLSAVRANIVPGLFLQAFALAIVLAYEFSGSVREALDFIGRVKVEGGFVYSILATSFFGGLVPYVVLTLARRIPPERRLKDFAFYLLFWGYKGFEVDLLYLSQAAWFGDERDFITIFSKTLVDQLAYGPLLAVPTQTVFFLWKDSGYSLAGVRDALRKESLWARLIVVMASNWFVWIPAVAIIYSLPVPLQLPLSNLVLTFWTLILTFVSRSETEK